MDKKDQYRIERRARGLYLGYDWKEDQRYGGENFTFDVESMIIEAIK